MVAMEALWAKNLVDVSLLLILIAVDAAGASAISVTDILML